MQNQVFSFYLIKKIIRLIKQKKILLLAMIRLTTLIETLAINKLYQNYPEKKNEKSENFVTKNV